MPYLSVASARLADDAEGGGEAGATRGGPCVWASYALQRTSPGSSEEEEAELGKDQARQGSQEPTQWRCCLPLERPGAGRRRGGGVDVARGKAAAWLVFIKPSHNRTLMSLPQTSLSVCSTDSQGVQTCTPCLREVEVVL